MITLLVSETRFYLIYAGIVFVAIYALIFVCLLAASPWSGILIFGRRIWHVLIFLLILFVYGAIGNCFWIALLSDRFYKTADPLTDFIPLIPFGWWAIDPGCGGKLLGNAQMWQLQAIWLVSAIAAWSLTIATYRLLAGSKGFQNQTPNDRQ